MPFTQPQHSKSGKRRRGGIGVHLAVVLALVLVTGAGGPAGAAHALVQLADDALELAHLVAGLAATGAALALVFRLALICWQDRHVHVVTDAAWPRGTRREHWTEAA